MNSEERRDYTADSFSEELSALMERDARRYNKAFTEEEEVRLT